MSTITGARSRGDICNTNCPDSACDNWSSARTIFERCSTSSSASTIASRNSSAVLAVNSATSICPRMDVNGVRNSWETSVENWRICSKELSRRDVMSLNALISRSSSSPAPRKGMRTLRFEPLSCCAACATEFSGIKARPAISHPRSPPVRIAATPTSR